MSACVSPAASQESFLPLMVGQLTGAAGLHASCLGALATVASSGADQLAFELREATEDRQHEPPVRRGGVRRQNSESDPGPIF
jgi:hypothetical protein